MSIRFVGVAPWHEPKVDRYIRIVSFTYLGQETFDEEPELHVYSNRPAGRAGFVVLRHPFDAVACIPTDMDATTLRMELYTRTRAEDGQLVLNHSGKRTVTLGAPPFPIHERYMVSLECHENEDMRHAEVVFEVGTAVGEGRCKIDIRAMDQPVPDITIDSVRPDLLLDTDQYGDAIVRCAAEWMFSGSYEVIVDELADVHIAQMKDHMPGFAYALIKPFAPEDEGFITRALEISYGRLRAVREKGFTDDWQLPATKRGRSYYARSVNLKRPDREEYVADQEGNRGALDLARAALADEPGAMRTFSLLVAYTLQFIANAYPYLEDRCGHTSIERFSSNLRITGADDCEGLAKEMLMIADCIRQNESWLGDLALAANKVCRCFTVALQLGAVTFHRLDGEAIRNGRTAPSAEFPTGRPSDYHAHAYVVLIPNSIADRTLGPSVVLDDWAIIDPPEMGLVTMAVDGTNIKHPLTMSQSETNERTGSTAWYKNISKRTRRRMKRTQFVEDTFYQYAFSNLVMSGLRSMDDPHMQVFEVYYTSEDANNQPVRGVRFSDAMGSRRTGNVNMNACYVPSGEQLAHIQATLAMEEHPIPPHVHGTSMRQPIQDQIDTVTALLQEFRIPVLPNATATEYEALGASGVHHVYLTMADITDNEFIRALIDDCRGQIAGVAIDAFSESLVSATVVLRI